MVLFCLFYFCTATVSSDILCSKVWVDGEPGGHRHPGHSPVRSVCTRNCCPQGILGERVWAGGQCGLPQRRGSHCLRLVPPFGPQEPEEHSGQRRDLQVRSAFAKSHLSHKQHPDFLCVIYWFFLYRFDPVGYPLAVHLYFYDDHFQGYLIRQEVQAAGSKDRETLELWAVPQSTLILETNLKEFERLKNLEVSSLR